MKLKFYLRFLFLVMSTGLLGQSFAQQLKPITVQQIDALIKEKNSRTPAQKKMASELLQAAREKRGQKMAEGVDLEPAKVNPQADGRVKVDIDGDITDELLSRIRAAGGEIIFPSKQYHTVRALIDLSVAETIANYKEVRFIQPAALAFTVGAGIPGRANGNKKLPSPGAPVNYNFSPLPRLSLAQREARVKNALKKYLEEHKEFDLPVTHSGSVNSQGDHSHLADSVRNKYGYAGQGIKIGVLSDSYNRLGGAAADVLNDDLPGTGNPYGNTTPVTVVQDYLSSPAEDEGRAMLQIVHDIAPKAQLFFATGEGGEASFASNIVALRNTYGCDIIIDDLGYYSESVFQDGIVAQAVITVTAAGALYFSSAGNEGSVAKGTAGVWEGDFTDGGSPTFSTGNAKTGSVHNFGSVSTPVVSDSITSLGGPYNLHWSDPRAASTNDYDLFLLKADGTVRLMSTTTQNGTQNPYEIINSTGAAGDRLVVFKATGAAVRAIHLNTNRGELKVATVGQTHGHSCVTDAYCVAAIPATGLPFTSANGVEYFSSDGLRKIFYNPDGTAVKPGNVLFSTNGGTTRNKPDITAADGVSTTLPASTGLNPFYGTSAAAPHAGAIAALLKSANTAITPAQVRTILTTTALDIETPGYDNVSGYGVERALQAMQSLNPAGLPYINAGTITTTEASGNGNGAVEAGETGNLFVQLRNYSLVNASNVVATVTTATSGITVTQGSATYGTINASASATNTSMPFKFTVGPSVACGTVITFQIKITFDGGVGTVGYTVTTALSGPGTVVTSNADNGAGTLRNAVANACVGSAITFDPSVTNIVLTSGEIAIGKGLVITGPGAQALTISGNNLSRIFNITAGTSVVSISGVTIRDGKPPASNAYGGGGILVNTGTVNLTGCSISNNNATLSSSRPYGGGIENEGGVLTIDKCSIINNTATLGGGIINEGAGTSNITITNSTIAGNVATRTTLGGGGIINLLPMSLTNCTVFGNSAANGGNLYSYSGTITFTNTIIAGGTLNVSGGAGPDVYGTAGLYSADYNLIQNTAGGTITGTTTHNITGVSPALLPLANYGGSTPTLLPLPNSPVINAGDPALTSGTDQRGFARVVGTQADIGSVEANYATATFAGNSQSATVNTAFATPLQAKVTESGNNISGVTVYFTAPSTGPSGTFPGGLVMATALTNASGIATAPTFTANGIAGSYTVKDSIGPAFAVANFSLTNIAASSSITNYFRTRQSGNWSDAATWESATDAAFTAGVVSPATLAPDYNANAITVRNAHTVTITANVTTDQTTINSGGAVILNPNVVLTLNDGAGTDLTVSSGGSLTVKSTAAGTGSIGNSTTATTSGNVTVERYLSSLTNRAYRLLAPSVNTTTSIHANWQEGATSRTNNPAPGYGTHITGTTVDQTNGFDATTTGQGSLLTLNTTTNAYEYVSNTNVSTLDAKKGYLLYLRGDRSIDLNSTANPLPSSNTTLRATGTLLTGTQTFTGTAANTGAGTGFNLLTNPYASAINWVSVFSANTGLAPAYTLFDPNIGSQGGYVTVNTQGVKSNAGSNATTSIQSGQAFFVQATGAAPTVTIQESHKSTSNNVDVFRQGAQTEIFTSSLYYTNAQGQRINADGVTSVYNNAYDTAVDENDAEQIANFDEDIAIRRSGHDLSIESRPLIDTKDTIPFVVARLQQRPYEWQFSASNFNAPGLTALLVDNFTGQRTAIALSGTTVIPFTVTSSTASSALNRFQVVFAQGVNTPLPISGLSVRAYQKNKDIQVEWTVQTEVNTDRYEVETSGDARQFTKATTVTAANAASTVSYNWLDVSATEGANYYRIKALGKDGQAQYSKVVRVDMGKTAYGIALYPNPVSETAVTLSVNLPKGKYSVVLTNAAGQQVYKTEMVHGGGAATQTLPLRAGLAQGSYQLTVSEGKSRYVQQLIKQ